MDTYSFGNHQIGHDKLDPLDDLEVFAVNLAHLSDYHNSGEENEKDIKDGHTFHTKIGNMELRNAFFPIYDTASYHIFTHLVSPPSNSRYSFYTFHGLVIDTRYAVARSCVLE